MTRAGEPRTFGDVTIAPIEETVQYSHRTKTGLCFGGFKTVRAVVVRTSAGEVTLNVNGDPVDASALAWPTEPSA